VTSLICIAAFLLSDYEDFQTIDARKSGDERWIVGISTIAVKLYELLKDRRQDIA